MPSARDSSETSAPPISRRNRRGGRERNDAMTSPTSPPAPGPATIQSSLDPWRTTSRASSIASPTSRIRARNGVASSPRCSAPSSWCWSPPVAGMMGHAFPGLISRTAAVVAPGLMVMAIILFMGKISGAHLNPAVTSPSPCAGTSRGGGCPATSSPSSPAPAAPPWFLQAVINVSATYGSNYPAHGYSNMARVLDGDDPHHGPGQRDPRHRIGRAEHRHQRRLRRRRLHRAAGLFASPISRRLHEPGPHARPRPRSEDFTGLLDLHRRAPRRRRHRGGASPSSCAVAAAARPVRARPRARCSPRWRRRQA